VACLAPIPLSFIAWINVNTSTACQGDLLAVLFLVRDFGGLVLDSAFMDFPNVLGWNRMAVAVHCRLPTPDVRTVSSIDYVAILAPLVACYETEFAMYICDKEGYAYNLILWNFCRNREFRYSVTLRRIPRHAVLLVCRSWSQLAIFILEGSTWKIYYLSCSQRRKEMHASPPSQHWLHCGLLQRASHCCASPCGSSRTVKSSISVVACCTSPYRANSWRASSSFSATVAVSIKMSWK
jgi:hypothetical protein